MSSKIYTDGDRKTMRRHGRAFVALTAATAVAVLTAQMLGIGPFQRGLMAAPMFGYLGYLIWRYSEAADWKMTWPQVRQSVRYVAVIILAVSVFMWVSLTMLVLTPTVLEMTAELPEREGSYDRWLPLVYVITGMVMALGLFTLVIAKLRASPPGGPKA